MKYTFYELTVILEILSAAVLLDERIVLNSENVIFTKSLQEDLDNI